MIQPLPHLRRIATLIAAASATAAAQTLDNPNVLDAASPNAREVVGLFGWVIGFSILVLLVVMVFLGAAIWRGWRERDLDEEPHQTHGNLTLEVTWTVVPLAILGVLLVLTVGSIYRLDGFAAPEDSIEVTVVGQQFWWEMVYTNLDGGPVVTANELVVPVGRPVELDLGSIDVMHSFWIPQLAGKTDLIPGNERVLWFTPDREGVYYGQCAELCGDSHANMRLRLVALSPEAFETWVAAARTPADPPGDERAARGQQLFVSKGCIGCHAVQGVNTFNRVGPDLSHIGSRTSIAAGMLANTPENMIRWLRYTDTVKPGVAMPNLGLTQDEAEALAAYLQGLTLPGFDLAAALERETDAGPVATAPSPAPEVAP